MKSTQSKLNRAKFWIKHFVETTKPRCYFCREIMDWKSFYPKMSGKQNDDWTEHHINGDHDDDRPENRTPSHSGCHRSYHRKLDEEAMNKEVNEIIEKRREC